MKITKDEITAFAKILDNGRTVEFLYHGFDYEIFPSLDTGYVVNIYSHDEKDEYGNYLNKFLVDGGHCTGSSKDAICFML